MAERARIICAVLSVSLPRFGPIGRPSPPALRDGPTGTGEARVAARLAVLVVLWSGARDLTGFTRPGRGTKLPAPEP